MKNNNQREFLKSLFPEKKQSRIVINDFILYMDWDFGLKDWTVIVTKNDMFARNKMQQEARIQRLF